MHCDLSWRQREDQPPVTGVDRLVLQHVAEKRSVSLGVLAVDDDVSAVNHAPSIPARETPPNPPLPRTHGSAALLPPPFAAERQYRSATATPKTKAGGKSMATTGTERILEDWAAAWSSHDAEKVLALFTDDCIYEDVTFGVVNHGRKELRAFIDGVFAGIPDFKIELTVRFVIDASGAMEWIMSGTHKGDFP